MDRAQFTTKIGAKTVETFEAALYHDQRPINAEIGKIRIRTPAMEEAEQVL